MARNRTVADLAGLLSGTLLTPAGTGGDTVIGDVTHDSRMAGPGTLFVAIRGKNHDGHAFVAEAVGAGSPAVCVDHPTHSGSVEIVVDDTRAALGPLAASVFDNPSHSLPVVGVTGTNGKTTVTHHVESIAARAGRKTGLIGTITTRIAGTTIESSRTTPEASDFQRMLARMCDEGADLAAAEVSSHALELGRVTGTRFAVAAFTNLSQDHLDFHHDMDSYFAAKQKLFTDHEVGTAVVNVADEAGARIARAFQGDLVKVGEGGDVAVVIHERSPEGTMFTLESRWGDARITSPVVGDFNVENAAIASACCLAVGMTFDEVVDGLGSLPLVPGRFELVSGDDPIRVVVDYAHTPDGIRQAIRTARTVGGGKVVAVVGAGGDRDRAKRPEMGAAASEADFAMITTDNPRSEDPSGIIDDVAAGMPSTARWSTELDRRAGIDRALRIVDDGDVVLILGRGHEPFQQLAEESIPFDDREVARSALARRRSSAGFGPDSGSMGP